MAFEREFRFAEKLFAVGSLSVPLIIPPPPEPGSKKDSSKLSPCTVLGMLAPVVDSEIEHGEFAMVKFAVSGIRKVLTPPSSVDRVTSVGAPCVICKETTALAPKGCGTVPGSAGEPMYVPVMGAMAVAVKFAVWSTPHTPPVTE